MKRAIILLAGCALVLAGCGRSGHHARASTSTHATTAVRPIHTTPHGAPATTTAEGPCPLLDTPTAAENVGVRMGRVTVQSSGGKAVGCRFYADQDPTYRASEHLPGADQPVMQIVSTRYRDATTAHNAMVELSRKGSNAYRSDLAAGIEGISFQTRFDPADGDRDWAYTFHEGTTVVVVTTAQTDTAFDARAVASSIAPRFR